MDVLFTYANLNIVPLDSYDILIGMDWLEVHRVKLDCYNKNFECLDEEGNPRVGRYIPKAISVRHISTKQLKKLCRKSCILYAAHVLEATENETPRLEEFHVARIQGCFS